jgi:hypothetical protein
LHESDFVIEERSPGDVDAANHKLEFLKGMNIINKTEQILDLWLNCLFWNLILLGIPDRSIIYSFHLATGAIKNSKRLKIANN